MASEYIPDLPLDQLVCRPQVRKRFDPEAVAGMAATVTRVGVQMPVLARRDPVGKLVVIDGEMRVRAAREAGLTTVPVFVVSGTLSDADVLLRQLVANVQRTDLKPLERAEGIERLLDATGWTAAEAAEHLGLSAASVSKSLALLSLPEAVRDRLADGSIAASAAYELARVDDPAAQLALAEQLAGGTLTRDGVRGRRRAGTKLDSSDTKPASRVVACLDERRSLTLTGPCDGLDGLIAALEELLGKARKVRPQAVSLPTFVKMLRDQAKSAAAACPSAPVTTNR